MEQCSKTVVTVPGCHELTFTVTGVPQQPWEELVLDLLGPYVSGKSLLVLVDYNSRWIRATTS